MPLIHAYICVCVWGAEDTARRGYGNSENVAKVFKTLLMTGQAGNSLGVRSSSAALFASIHSVCRIPYPGSEQGIYVLCVSIYVYIPHQIDTLSWSYVKIK